MKKNTIFILICILLTISTIKFTGFVFGCVKDETLIDCLSILQKSITESPKKWAETHCKETAQHIIDVLSKNLKPSETSCNGLDGLISTPMGQKLFSTSEQFEHLLQELCKCMAVAV